MPAIKSQADRVVVLDMYNNKLAPTVDLVNGHTDVLDEDAHAVLALRNLIFDICNQNNGGHGGSAIGMAAIGVALYKYVMRYNPSNPDWFDRDRFVLSNGEWPENIEYMSPA